VHHVLGFGSAQELKEHYHRVRHLDSRNIFLFEKVEHEEEAAPMRLLNRAWERIAHVAIRVYPKVADRDLYFVDFQEARPSLAAKAYYSETSKPHGRAYESFLRAMRRAGLKRPMFRTPPRDLWGEYVKFVGMSCGEMPIVAPTPAPALSIPTPIYVVEPPLDTSPTMHSVFSPDDASVSSPLVLNVEIVDSPLVLAAESPTSQASLAAPSVGTDEWTDNISDFLSEASGEELESICRELLDPITNTGLV